MKKLGWNLLVSANTDWLPSYKYTTKGPPLGLEDGCVTLNSLLPVKRRCS